MAMSSIYFKSQNNNRGNYRLNESKQFKKCKNLVPDQRVKINYINKVM